MFLQSFHGAAGENNSASAICPCPQSSVLESFPMLASFIEEISDWDFPDPDMARAVAIKVLPSTTPYLIVQYREPLRSSRRFLGTSNPHRQYYSLITKVGTGISTIR